MDLLAAIDLRIPQTIPFINLSWDDALFLILSAVVLGAGLFVVLSRNIIRSGLWMILSFAALAGVYVLLGAPLVAAAQVLIYIGAISVLILFAVMLTQSKSGPARLVFHHQAWAAGLAAFGLAILFGVVIAATAWPEVVQERVPSATGNVARLLFDQYVLPFEAVSVLLLAAVIGAVFLAKREDSDNPAFRETVTVPGLDQPPGGYTGSAPSSITGPTAELARPVGSSASALGTGSTEESDDASAGRGAAGELEDRKRRSEPGGDAGTGPLRAQQDEVLRSGS